MDHLVFFSFSFLLAVLKDVKQIYCFIEAVTNFLFCHSETNYFIETNIFILATHKYLGPTYFAKRAFTNFNGLDNRSNAVVTHLLSTVLSALVVLCTVVLGYFCPLSYRLIFLLNKNKYISEIKWLNYNMYH